MQAVEVLKGSSQIQYGPYTTGGAINFVSTEIPKSFKGKISTSYGSFNTGQTHTTIGNSSKNFGYMLEYLNYNSNGFKSLGNKLNTGFDINEITSKFRFEIFKKTDGITFINDSKSTNGLSIKSALSNCINLKITNIVLILGGKSKGIDYSSYIDSSSIDIKIVAYGKAADEIKNKLPNYDVDIITDFNESVHHSIKIAEEYSLNGVLLSPGCSSFDQFNNFEHRGNVFKDIVEEYYS